MMMWPWILKLAYHTFEECNVAPQVYNTCMMEALNARDGISTIHTYVETQVPFPYVHVINLVVNINNIVVSVKCGIVAGIAVRAVLDGSGGVAERWIIRCEILNLLIVPIIYHGLLAISYTIFDPFGDDVLDFPIKIYSDYVLDSCRALYKSRYCPGEFKLFPDVDRVKMQSAPTEEVMQPMTWSRDQPSSLRVTTGSFAEEPAMLEPAAEPAEGCNNLQEDTPESMLRHTCAELSEAMRLIRVKLSNLDEFVRIRRIQKDAKQIRQQIEQGALGSPKSPGGNGMVQIRTILPNDLYGRNS